MTKLGYALVAFVFAAVMCAALIRFQPSGASRGPSESLACIKAQRYVTAGLKAPSTAAFAPCRKPDTITTKSGNTWTVISWVDAQNGFGAMLRTDTVVVMEYRAKDETWKLVDFEFVSR